MTDSCPEVASAILLVLNKFKCESGLTRVIMFCIDSSHTLAFLMPRAVRSCGEAAYPGTDPIDPVVATTLGEGERKAPDI